ncbi:PilZ domain-containing protein [Vibrio crassostreae]|uniref:PilZ domain-containing protein n=1 Tax=Vibrio crassostreae TaxID=246167 RepID=UPI001B304E8D|nr:PilZ domain-containing protein [Vibrio crassostreae]
MLKRRFPRKEFVGNAMLIIGDSKLQIYITDISCTGVSIIDSDMLFINELSNGDEGEVVLKFDGKILRASISIEWKRGASAGLSIAEIDEDNFSLWLQLLNAIFNK